MLTEFFDAPAGQAVIIIGLLATADFALGVFAAFRDNVFSMDAIAAWLRRNLAGRPGRAGSRGRPAVPRQAARQ